MPEIFFIGDTHFGHKRVLEFSPQTRPFVTIEEHNEALIERWNRTVTKRDTVWHLGDFCFGRANISLAGRLNGYKRLVLGNHDTYRAEEYLEHFDRLYGAAEFKGYVLTHIPVSMSQMTRYRGNIHGHLHSNNMGFPCYHNVSCEQINCTPISFDELIRKETPDAK